MPDYFPEGNTPLSSDQPLRSLQKINSLLVGQSEQTSVESITGTANQVIASSPTGDVTLSLPQSIATTSTVTFGSIQDTPMGTVTPDTGAFTTLGASGISLLAGGIGIGASPDSTTPINLAVSSNTNQRVILTNSAGGTAARMGILVAANAGDMSLTAFGSGFTTSGLNVADSASVTASSTLSAGLYLRAEAAAPVVFGINGSEAGRWTSTAKFSPASGVLPDSGGIKHARVTTGPISGAATALVTVTWGTAFADANYTVSASVVDATTSSLSLSVVHVESVTASAVTVRVINNAVGELTGLVHAIALHD